MSSELKIMPFPTNRYPETAAKILASHAEFAQGLDDPAWLQTLRRAGADYVAQNGLPTPKLEGWKFTNLIPLVRDYGGQSGAVKIDTKIPSGVSVQPLADALGQDWVRELLSTAPDHREYNAEPSLTYLANAYLRDGLAIDVPANSIVDQPLDITMECEAGAFYTTHHVIRVGANAHLTIWEDDRGQGQFWKNGVTHIILEQGAHLTHVRVQEESSDAVYTHHTKISVARDAHYNAVTLNTGAGLSRHQSHILLTGPGALCHLNGASLLRGAQHSDTTILIEHLAPHCESNQNMRTILDDRAHGVFQGKVHVHQPAQKTNGYQLSKAIILSEGAEMDTKPELEIYADDVKCSHGATTGQLDEEPLFYMQSRGIPAQQARALLIESFAQDIFDEVRDEQLKEGLLSRVRHWLYDEK